METITLTKQLTAKRHYNLIVCGGGVAGCAAAITAAKRGKSVLLLEKSNILGGLATLGLINLFVPMCNGRGKQIIFGLAEKWLRDSAKYSWDTIPEPWRDGEPKEYTEIRYIQRYSPNIFALQLTEEVAESGADLLFDIIATQPVMDGKVIKGVVTHSKGGQEYYTCDMLLDVTGDCDVLRAGGIPTVAGKNYYVYVGKYITLDTCKTAVEKGDIGKAITNVCGGFVNLFGDNQPKDIPTWSGLSTEDVTDYLVRNQHDMLERLKESDRKTREVVTLPGMPQFRTTCHLDGDYTLTVSDCYKHFEDSICAINDFEHRDHLFEVPLRTICRKDYPNVLTAGRGASGEGYGWDCLRVIPPAILTGQAAAEVACLAIDTGVSVADVDIKTLHQKLEEDNIMVHFPDEYVPEDKTVVIHGVCHDGHF